MGRSSDDETDAPEYTASDDQRGNRRREHRTEIHAQTVRALLAVVKVASRQSRRSISNSIVSRSCVIVSGTLGRCRISSRLLETEGWNWRKEMPS